MGFFVHKIFRVGCGKLGNSNKTRQGFIRKSLFKDKFFPPELCKKKKTNCGILCSGCKLIHTTVMLTNVTPVNCRRHHNMMCTSVYIYWDLLYNCCKQLLDSRKVYIFFLSLNIIYMKVQKK